MIWQMTSLRNTNQASESQKATGPDEMTLKIIKLSTDVIEKHLTNIINTNSESSCFSENAKIASVKSAYKKKADLMKTVIDQLAF